MEAYIRFMAPVIPKTANQLLQAIDAKLKEGASRIHLLISSPGGSVFHGLSIYNFLKGVTAEVYTYNFGSVDSIGVILFCAGDRRFTVPHARYLIHPVGLTVNQGASFDEKRLEEKLKGLQIDQRNIAKVISDTVGPENKSLDVVEADMNIRTTLDPDQAVEYGLVHEIKSELIPASASYVTINEQGNSPSPQPFPFGVPHGTRINVQGAPTNEAHSLIDEFSIGTYIDNSVDDFWNSCE